MCLDPPTQLNADPWSSDADQTGSTAFPAGYLVWHQHLFVSPEPLHHFRQWTSRHRYQDEEQLQPAGSHAWLLNTRLLLRGSHGPVKNSPGTLSRSDLVLAGNEKRIDGEDWTTFQFWCSRHDEPFFCGGTISHIFFLYTYPSSVSKLWSVLEQWWNCYRNLISQCLNTYHNETRNK